MKFSKCPEYFICDCSYCLTSCYAWAPKWSRIWIFKIWERMGSPVPLWVQKLPCCYSSIGKQKKVGENHFSNFSWIFLERAIRAGQGEQRECLCCLKLLGSSSRRMGIVSHAVLCCERRLDGSGCTPAIDFVIAMFSPVTGNFVFSKTMRDPYGSFVIVSVGKVCSMGLI